MLDELKGRWNVGSTEKIGMKAFWIVFGEKKLGEMISSRMLLLLRAKSNASVPHPLALTSIPQISD